MNKLDLEKYLEAYIFSFKLHKKQIRKGSNIPYFTHLSSVSNLIIENNGTTTQAIAGLLHDAVEDQGGLIEMVWYFFKWGNHIDIKKPIALRKHLQKHLKSWNIIP